MPVLTLNSVPVRYRLEDHAPGATAGIPLVLLHMAGGGSSVWGPVASLCGRRHLVLAPDFPGHGQSGVLPAQPDLPTVPGVSPHLVRLARFTLDFLTAAGHPRAVLCGHSMGGAVALTAALLDPARVAGLGLVCTSAQLQLLPGLKRQMHADYEAFVAGFTSAALPVNVDSATQHRNRPVFPQAPREVVLADFESVDGFDVLARLQGLRMPAAIIAGEMDVLTPPANAEAMLRALPDATLTMVPAAGHLLPRQFPAPVAHALLELMARVL